MASDYLLEIDGVQGESTDDKHKGAIEIDPEYAFVYIQLAEAYEKSGRTALAQQTVEAGRGPAARNGDPNLMRQLDDIAARLPA